MIYDAPTINVGGIGRLKVYSIDSSAQTLDSPGKFTVSYIDKDNILAAPNLSFQNATSLRVGSFTLKGYPVSYRRTLSAEGESLLVVTYIDNSFILDKYFVGLRHKHWDMGTPYSALYKDLNFQTSRVFGELHSYKQFNVNSPTSQPPSFLILVGDQVDPCSNNFSTQPSVDVCNPCPEPANSNSEMESARDCEKLRSLSIFDVDYSFNDLITAVRSKIFIDVSANYNSNYRTNYTGSLRDVLQGWCSDLGLSFYFINNKIVIYDLSQEFVIPSSLNNSQTISKVEERSIEHRFNEASITHFAAEGEVREYNCASNSQKLVCRPVTLEDLIGSSLIGAYPSSDTSSYYRLIELMAMLSGYHPNLREMVTWFDVYGIRSAADAEALVNSSSTSSEVSSISTKGGGYKNFSRNADDQGKYTLPLLSMSLKRVFKKDSAEFETLLKSAQITDDIRNVLTSSDKSPYLFVASRSERAYSNKVSWEANIAENFLGKYFLRMYETYSNGEPSIQLCGSDSATYYKQGVSSLDFGKFMPPLSDGYQKLLDKFLSSETPGSKVSAYRYSGNDITVKDSFILVSRGSNWFPTMSQGEEINTILELSKEFQFINLGKISNFDESLQVDSAFGNGLKFDGTKDCLYIGFSMPSGFNTSIENGVSHPEESEDTSVNKNGRCRVSVDDFLVPVSLGLRSTKTREIKCGGYSFFMPAQGCVDVAKNSGGYHVLVNNNKSLGKNLVIPKAEFVEAGWPTSNDVGRINVGYKEIDSASINEILLVSQALGEKRCFPSEDSIRNHMREYMANTTYSNANTTLIKRTFELVGLPSVNYDLSDGLIEFSVRVSSQGVRSYLTFSNMVDRVSRKSTKLLEFELKQNQIERGLNSVRINKNLIASNDRDITS
jgi:hypothetical protein